VSQVGLSQAREVVSHDPVSVFQSLVYSNGNLRGKFLAAGESWGANDVRGFGIQSVGRAIDATQMPEEANCTLPVNSGIAAAAASWHNSEALADLRHGTFLRPGLNGSHAFSGKHLCPHGQPAAE
jgi:hypothetical protein